MSERPWKGPRPVDPDAGLMDRKPDLRPVDGPVTITMPVPPSVNELFYNRRANASGKGRVKSRAYLAWLADATFDVRKQAVAGMIGCIKGRYFIDISIKRGSTKADIWNLEKAISDLLQAEKVIANDNLCDGGSIRWSDDLDAASVTVRAA